MTSTGAAVAPRRGNLVAASSDPRAGVRGQASSQVGGHGQSGAEPSTTMENATGGWLSGSGGCGAWPQKTSTSTVNEKSALLFDEATYSTVTQPFGAMGNGHRRHQERDDQVPELYRGDGPAVHVDGVGRVGVAERDEERVALRSGLAAASGVLAGRRRPDRRRSTRGGIGRGGRRDNHCRHRPGQTRRHRPPTDPTAIRRPSPRIVHGNRLPQVSAFPRRPTVGHLKRWETEQRRAIHARPVR